MKKLFHKVMTGELKADYKLHRSYGSFTSSKKLKSIGLDNDSNAT